MVVGLSDFETGNRLSLRDVAKSESTPPAVAKRWISP